MLKFLKTVEDNKTSLNVFSSKLLSENKVLQILWTAVNLNPSRYNLFGGHNSCGFKRNAKCVDTTL